MVETVVSRCTDTGSIGYPLLGSARGAKEAENRLLGRSLDQDLLSTIQACNQRDTRSYPGSGHPEAKSPAPACLDDGFFIVWLTMEPPGWGTRKGFGWR